MSTRSVRRMMASPYFAAVRRTAAKRSPHTGADTAETEIVLAVILVARLAGGTAAALGRGVERPAADDVPFFILRRVRPWAGPDIHAPFPDVTVHLVQTPGVGLLGAN